MEAKIAIRPDTGLPPNHAFTRTGRYEASPSVNVEAAGLHDALRFWPAQSCDLYGQGRRDLTEI